MLPVEFSGKAGDFLADGRGDAGIGSAAGFLLRRWPVLPAFGFGVDLGVKLDE